MALYSFEWTEQFHYHDREDIEYWINYNGEDDKLDIFLQQDPKHKIVINLIEDKFLIDFLTEEKAKMYANKTSEKYSPFIFCLKYNDYGINISTFMKQLEIPFFFDRHINSYDELNGMIEEGVKEIYICEELCFNIPKVAEIAHSKGVGIRIIPNICQSKWDKTIDLKQFFIRPEDMYLYSQYIDVFEFWGKKHMYDVLYEAYVIQKMWYGPLKEIILGFENDVDNRCILPDFGYKRLSCDKKCFKGRNCSICDTVINLADTLASKGMFLKKITN